MLTFVILCLPENPGNGCALGFMELANPLSLQREIFFDFDAGEIAKALANFKPGNCSWTNSDRFGERILRHPLVQATRLGFLAELLEVGFLAHGAHIASIRQILSSSFSRILGWYFPVRTS